MKELNLVFLLGVTLGAFILLNLIGSQAGAETVVREWDFTSSREGWTTAGTIDPVPDPIQYSGDGWPGIIYADCTGSDPQFISPTISIEAKSWHKIVVRICTHYGTSHELRVYWKRSEDSTFSETRSKAVDYNSSTGQTFRTVEVDVGSNSYWSGTITQFRIDPSRSTSSLSLSH